MFRTIFKFFGIVDETQKCVLFDWGGTLAKPHLRHVFVGGTIKQKHDTLWSDTISTLDYLKSKGYLLGIVSNTKFKSNELKNALNTSGLMKYFDVQVYSSDPNMCLKSCSKIFQEAISQLNVLPENCYYIGDNYEADVEGSHSTGMKPILLNKNGHYISSDIDEFRVKPYRIIKSLKDLQHFL